MVCGIKYIPSQIKDKKNNKRQIRNNDSIINKTNTG